MDAKKAVPHVTALLARKTDEAKQASEGARDAFAGLRTRRDLVQKNYDLLETRLCESDRSCLPGAVGALLSAYKAAVASVAEYSAFVEQAIEGLLLDDNKQNVGAQVDQNLAAARDTIGLLEPKRAPLQQLKDDLTRAAVDPSGNGSVQRACKLLFCDIYGGPKIRLDNACRSVPTEGASRQPLSATNPLCASDPAQQVIAGAPNATAVSVCRAVGFDPAQPRCD